MINFKQLKSIRKQVHQLIKEKCGLDPKTGEFNFAELTEQCAWNLNHDEWLDDPNHEIWDIIINEVEKQKNIK